MNVKRLRFATAALHIFLAAIIILLLVSSLGFMRDGPTVHSVTYVTKVKASVDGGPWEEITLPHAFKDLESRTPVNIQATITPNQDDGVYIKTVYSPATVFLDGRCVFYFGKEQNYPSYMLDPATEIHIVETYGNNQNMRLDIQYLSPVSRDTLMVHPPMVGTSKELMLERSHKYGLSMVFSMVQIVGGIALVLISVYINLADRKGILFLWLGLFSLTTGMWAFGENNLSVTIFRSSALLYMMDFTGLFAFIVPLLHFCRSIVGFRNPRWIWYSELFFSFSACFLLLLQLTGILSCSSSMYFYHITLPPIIIALTVSVIREYFRYKSSNALRMILPLTILSFTALLEVFNYRLPFTYVYASLFQIGILCFLLIMGITAGMQVKDSINLQNMERELDAERKIVNIQIREQQQRSNVLTRHEKILSQQRHDLRHQLAAIEAMVQPDNEELRCYLQDMMKRIPQSPHSFCENRAVNAVVSYHLDICKEQNIKYDIKIAVPAHIERISDEELCAVFGNLLENATEACARMQEGQKFIRLRSIIKSNFLTITMDNSFNGKLRTNNGHFFSSKRDGYGIGLTSIETIAKHSGGDVDFHAEENTFLSSVYLHM